MQRLKVKKNVKFPLFLIENKKYLVNEKIVQYNETKVVVGFVRNLIYKNTFILFQKII